MMLLFGDKLAPITSEIGFIEGEPHAVAEWFCAWQTQVLTAARPALRVTTRRVEGPLIEMVRTLEPLTTVERRRFLFVETKSRWTAYFDNGAAGSDAATLSHVASQLSCAAVRMVAVPDSTATPPSSNRKGRFGATIFELYGPEPKAFLNHVRTIASVNDGGRWAFDQSGVPLPFEPHLDQSKPARSRFALPELQSVLEGLGVMAFDEAFYEPRGHLVERQGPLLPNAREFTLIQARERLGMLS